MQAIHQAPSALCHVELSLGGAVPVPDGTTCTLNAAFEVDAFAYLVVWRQAEKQDVRFLRAEEIKELLAWTAQELQTVQDSAAQGNPASGAAWSLFLRYDDDTCYRFHGTQLFPAWLSKLTDRLTACFQTA